jgi:hypothetical protein
LASPIFHLKFSPLGYTTTTQANNNTPAKNNMPELTPKETVMEAFLREHCPDFDEEKEKHFLVCEIEHNKLLVRAMDKVNESCTILKIPGVLAELGKLHDWDQHGITWHFEYQGDKKKPYDRRKVEAVFDEELLSIFISQYL